MKNTINYIIIATLTSMLIYGATHFNDIANSITKFFEL